MKFLFVCRNAAMATLALSACLLSTEARANDSKYFAASAVCAPYTAGVPDFAKLRFRPEGIINDSDSSKYVICNLPRDSETAWGTDSIFMAVAFRRTTTDTLAVTSNQCTLTVGFNGTEPLQSQTYSPMQETLTYGVLTIDDSDMPTSDANSYAVMVCRIVPGSLMDVIVVREANPTAS